MSRSRRQWQDSDGDSSEQAEENQGALDLENATDQSEDALAAANVALESDLAQLQVPFKFKANCRGPRFCLYTFELHFVPTHAAWSPSSISEALNYLAAQAMGFTKAKSREALEESNNDVQLALDWLVTNCI